MTKKVFIDLETVPDQHPGAFERYLDLVTPPANYKKQESIDKWMAENAEEKAAELHGKTGLNGLHGEICSIAFAVDDNEIESVTRGIDVESEGSLIRKFFIALGEHVTDSDAGFPRFEWIGHNVLEFDLRFLKQRCMVNSVDPLYPIPAEARHGSGNVFDTMKEWAGFRGYVKQDELVEAFGFSIEGNALAAELDGSMVWPLYQSGQFDAIKAYNEMDVHKVREIYRRMTYA